MEELTPEMRQRMSEALESAMKFVQELYELEIANRSMAEADAYIGGVLAQQLERLDVFSQFTYCTNLQEGNGVDALRGLQTGIRAAFIYGYLLAKRKYQKQEFTPTLTPTAGVLQ
jgi:hypothetical protein